MKPKPLDKVEIEWRLLEAIADYFEFPCAVFFMNYNDFKKMAKKNKKRSFVYRDAYEKLCQIEKLIIDEVKGKNEG